MSARLKQPITIAIKPSKIYSLILYGLHLLALILLVVSSALIALKFIAALLIACSVYTTSKRLKHMNRVSQLYIDNHQCQLRVEGELHRCACDMDRAITGWFIVLMLKPLNLSPGSVAPLFLVIFNDSMSQSDRRLLRAYLCAN